MWRSISRGQVWNGEVCNRAKDGSLYWVYTTIALYWRGQGQAVQLPFAPTSRGKNKLAEQEAEHLALHDSLTGLPNRRSMIEQAGSAAPCSSTSHHMRPAAARSGQLPGNRPPWAMPRATSCCARSPAACSSRYVTTIAPRAWVATSSC